jgi:hypothetical protein
MLLTFFASPIGRWVVVTVLILGALFTGAMYERNVQHTKDLDEFDKERKAQTDANLKAANDLNTSYRAKELADQLAKNQLGKDFDDYRRTHRARTDADRASALNGSLRLSVPSNCSSTNVSTVPSPGNAASGGNGPTRTELPAAVTADLLDLANDADDAVKQLTTCQAIVAGKPSSTTK